MVQVVKKKFLKQEKFFPNQTTDSSKAKDSVFTPSGLAMPQCTALAPDVGELAVQRGALLTEKAHV